MRFDPRQLAAVTRLELIRRVRSPLTLIAIISLAFLVMIGEWLHWKATRARPGDERLLGHAIILAALLGLRFGFSTDRGDGSERLLAGNLVSYPAYFFGKVLALLASISALATTAFILSTVVSAGDWQYALWYTLSASLAISLFTPLLLMVELGMDTRVPGPAVLVIFASVALITAITSGADTFLRLMAFTMSRPDYSTLLPLVYRVGIALALTILAYPIWRWRCNR